LAALAVSVALGLAARFSPRTKVRFGRCGEPASVSAADFSHRVWDELLARYVDAHGNVDYRAWKDRPEDHRRLIAYIESASDVDLDPPAPRESRLALWINLYNALTVAGILREYPTSSILNHTHGWLYRFWDDLELAVDGQYYSLTAIEHQILRPMKEPRIHMAIVCASRGCPRLRAQAYRVDRLEEQLDDNARYFFARNTSYQLSPDEKTAYLSPILQWFAEDFGPTDADRWEWVRQYLPTPRDRAVDPARIRYLRYDWSLNDRPAGPA
jgi:hypothetical protein